VSKTKFTILQWVGVLATIVSIVVFVMEPSFPTPDKLLVFAAFICLIFKQAKEMLKRFVPFVGLLLVYESFRGIVPHLNTKVNFTWMPDVDRIFGFGQLPTVWLQERLWNGSVQWYDYMLYLTYMMHFVLPFVLAFVVWKTREKEYWRYMTAFLVVSFAGFLTFLAFPAAPPWMASNLGYIEHIDRISSSVWATLGIQDFPSVYNKISPNPVAAVPSLHAAYATLFALFAITLYKTRWRFIAIVYPIFIYFGTVYQGEHYLIDELLGGLYAVGAFFAAPYVVRFFAQCWRRINTNLHPRLVALKKHL
jgi:membrane-associated phospholipid phosphatase